IDFMNPAPDMDIYSLTSHYFDWVVTHMADMAIRLAKNPRRQAAAVGWEALFKGRREMAEAVAASPVIQAPLADAGSTAARSGAGPADDGRGGYLIGGGRSGEGQRPPPPPPGPESAEDDPYNAEEPLPTYDPPAGREEEQADEGAAEMQAASGYLIGGGRAGDPPPRSDTVEAADVDEVDSTDFLVGETAAGLEFEGDPGDAPDDVVDEEASEGHA
ncbi:MAG TPA: hypothetical protein VFT45_05410, partial [Longimicrobium sp.]|nr:hypothetical protein [Longimicrobium sp.]